jgi:hypothetical protein
MNTFKKMILAGAASALCGLSASAGEQLPITTIVGFEKSQNISVNGSCLRASIFDEEGPFPVKATVESCKNSGWHPYRWELELRMSGAARYYRIHPRSRPDLCLGILRTSLRAANPIVALDYCASHSVVNGVPTPNSDVDRQLWGIMPVNHDFAMGSYVLINAGLSGLATTTITSTSFTSKASNRPRVMTAPAGNIGVVVIDDYIALGSQLPDRSQHWHGQEIWCVITSKPPNILHASGREVGGAPAGETGVVVPINNPVCK